MKQFVALVCLCARRIRLDPITLKLPVHLCSLWFVNFLNILLNQCSLIFNVILYLLVQVDNFHNPKLKEQLVEAKLIFPVILKPQVACGVAEAHNMVLSCLVIPFSCPWYIDIPLIGTI